jgi:hypothetical protein
LKNGCCAILVPFVGAAGFATAFRAPESGISKLETQKTSLAQEEGPQGPLERTRHTSAPSTTVDRGCAFLKSITRLLPGRVTTAKWSLTSDFQQTGIHPTAPTYPDWQLVRIRRTSRQD